MTTGKTAPAEDPGTIAFHDDYVPGLAPGNYEIAVNHTVDPAPKPFGASQSFVVSAPQFALDPADIHAVSPPDRATGRFGEDLPFITLNKRMLPWERELGGAKETPWLALLVLDESELIDGAHSDTHAIQTTAGKFLQPEAGVLKPRIVKAADIPDDQACQYIKLSTATFTAAAPRLEELPLLCHVRKVDTGGQAAFGRADDGWYAVVAGNRFPRVQEGGARCIVHLVSMEGLAPYLTSAPVYTASGKADGTPVFSTIALLSLARWSFTALPDQGDSFDGLLARMISGKKPDNLWLRRDPALVAGDDAAAQEVRARIGLGYVPLTYRTRSGEDTFAWYRGPLSPGLPAAIEKKGPFPSADAALIYDADRGVIDASLAAAWQVGRTLALANQGFAQKVLDLRRKVHRRLDLIDERSRSRLVARPGDLAALTGTQLFLDAFVGAMKSGLVSNLAKPPMADLRPPRDRGASAPGADPVPPLADLLDARDVASVKELVEADLGSIAEQLAKWQLLQGVPFSQLVPDPAALPVESIRFFYVDPNWTEALLDGARSVGIHSTRDVRSDALIRGLIQDATAATVRALRERLAGVEPGPAPDGEERISGFLMRSDLVAGWPSLSVSAEDAKGQQLKLLRMEHLSSSVLLCLFLGAPATVRLREPHQGLRLGVEKDANQQPSIELRNVLPGQTNRPLGQSLGRLPTGSSMRSGADRVLDMKKLADGAAGALREKLGGKDPAALSPSDFAIQLIKSPEEQIFRAPVAP